MSTEIVDEWSGHPLNAEVAKAAHEIADAAAKAGYPLPVIYGTLPTPDHNDLHCVDLMVIGEGRTGAGIAGSTVTKAGDWVANYILANRTRLGVYLLIWNRKIIRSYDKPGIPAWTWAKYTGTDVPHIDHNHLQVVDGYKYQAPKVTLPGALYTVTASELNARSAPSTSAKIVAVRAKGYTVRIVSTKTAEGRKWGKGSGGAWYAMEFLKKKG